MATFFKTQDLIFVLAEEVSLIWPAIQVLSTILTFQVDCTHDLQNLRLVNKAFELAFSRELYRHLTFTVDTSLAGRLKRLLRATKLSSVRYLSFRMNLEASGASEVDEGELVPLVEQLLHHTPMLRSF